MATYDTIEDTDTTVSANPNNVSNWTSDDIRKSDILVFRESATEYIDTVVAPNGFQVGLLDEAFLTDLLVTGHITGSGVIYSEMGFSGSLQTLVDGSDYLRGTGGITITNHEDGYIEINGAGGGGGGSGSRIKEEITPAVLKTAGSVVEATGVPLAPYSYSDQLIDVFLNGDLLLQGTQTQVQTDGTHDFFIEADVTGNGQLIFRYDIDSQDELVLIAGTVGGGGGGGGTTYTAGTGLNLVGTQFSTNTDSTTIGTNVSGELQVLSTPGSLTNGQGINNINYNGSGNGSISVKTVSGGPITVTGTGIGLDFSPLNAVALSQTDEVIVSQGGSLGKTTVQDIVSLANTGTGAPTTATYLVASSSSDLSHERVLAGSNSISVTDGGANNQMTLSVVVDTGAGLEIVSGGLAVRIADFVGYGLVDNAGDIDVNVTALAGNGLTVIGNQLVLDFSQVASATNTIEINAGDGLASGGTVTIGDASSTINLEVQSTDLTGDGLSVSNNNLDVYLQGAGGIGISTGSPDSNGFTPIVIDASGVQGGGGTITGVQAGTGLTGGGNTGSVTIGVDYDDATNIITEASDGTGITIDEENDRLMIYDHDTTSVKYIKPSQLGSGGGAQAGLIGDPEDGAWDDGEGLWNDFTNSTPTGTAIDRINEFLKGLAPTAATNISTITTSSGNGTGVRLSFGTSNTVVTHENVAALGNLSDFNVNGNYTVTTNTDQRLGAFGSLNVVQGIVNGGSPADGSNYPEYAFGNADQGNLILEVNGATVYTLDLTSNATGAGAAGSGTGSHLTSNSGFYLVSSATSGAFPSGESFDQFKHRTAYWRAGTASQREGWNYAVVRHVIGATVYESNHVQWINDATGAAVAINVVNNSLSNLSLTGTKHLSGVNYYTGGTVDYACDVENFYSYVYGTTNMVVSSSQTNNVNVAPTTIDTIGGENHTKTLNVDESLTISSNKLLNQSVSVAIGVTHPLKNNVSGGGSSSVNNILLYNIAESNVATLKTTENFNGESFRMKTGDYNAQSDVTDAVNAYDSTVSLATNTGLQVWNQRLVWPDQSTNGGDFSSIANGPAGNVDYSGINTGERSYYRKFTNPGSSQSNFDLTIQGSGTLTTATNPSGDNIKVFIKLPQTTSNFTTGWLDLTVDFATNQYADGDGCLLGALDSSLNATNRATLGVNSVGTEESIIIKVIAASDWTGHISNMSISWG